MYGVIRRVSGGKHGGSNSYQGVSWYHEEIQGVLLEFWGGISGFQGILLEFWRGISGFQGVLLEFWRGISGFQGGFIGVLGRYQRISEGQGLYQGVSKDFKSIIIWSSETYVKGDIRRFQDGFERFLSGIFG